MTTEHRRSETVNRPSCLTSLVTVVLALVACQPVTENVGSSPAIRGCSTGGRPGSGGAVVASGGAGGMSVGSGVAGAGVAGAAGGPAASGGGVGSGGVTASGGAGGATTRLGWIPCGVTGGGNACTIPAGTVRVRYGDGPDANDNYVTQTFTNAVQTTMACASSTFGGNPNPCQGCENYCWYEGQVPLSLPAGTLTGPQIDLPVTVTPFPGYSEDRVAPTSDLGNASSGGAFREPCRFAKFDFQDPIVFPGQPEASHLHMFFGNTGVTEASTPMSIQTTGNSTCAGGTLNRSAYWVPAVIDIVTHKPIRPTTIVVYYKTGLVQTSEIHAVPEGLVMVSGDSHNTLPDVSPVRYSCISPSAYTLWTSNIPACPDTSYEVMGDFGFKQCWDGVHLDSPDHKSHMGDPVGTWPAPFHCPPAFPIALPLISYNIRWPTFPNGSANMRLSSDNYPVDGLNGGYSGHADYMVGWQRATIDKFTTYCLQTSTDCHGYLLGNGQILY